LAEMAPAVAAAYFRASARALPYLTGPQIAEWACVGKRLYKETWKSISLASDFLGGSPALLKTMTLAEITRLSRIVENIASRSADLGAACPESPIAPLHLLHHG